MLTNPLKKVLLALAGFLPAVAFAVPTLQLDIDGGYYNTEQEDMVSDNPIFNLYAYGNPGDTAGGGGNLTTDELLSTTYYLSIALTPTVETATDLGSISVNGISYDATNDFTFGTPPLDATANPNLTHGNYFETYYLEIAFQFDQTMTSSVFNVQTDGGSGPDTSGSDMFYNAFEIDMTNLLAGYNLHFDLYTTRVSQSGEIVPSLDQNGEILPSLDQNSGIVLGDFAPYSHDASTNVPEPGSLILFSLGLIGLGLFARRREITMAA